MQRKHAAMQRKLAAMRRKPAAIWRKHEMQRKHKIWKEMRRKHGIRRKHHSKLFILCYTQHLFLTLLDWDPVFCPYGLVGNNLVLWGYTKRTMNFTTHRNTDFD